MDFTNLELVEFFFKKFRHYVNMRRDVFILVDTYVLENIRSADGEIIKHFNNKQ